MKLLIFGLIFLAILFIIYDYLITKDLEEWKGW